MGCCSRQEACTGLAWKAHQMDAEKDLIDALENMLHKDFVNPQRIGCPGHESLVKLASQPGAPELAPIVAHLRQCAPCFDELKALRERLR
jgi:hypothetical protein